VCKPPTYAFGRLHLKEINRYVFVEMHSYCGPFFTWDFNQTKEYTPKAENDPIWPLFSIWLKEKYEVNKKANLKKVNK
jgi:hypothetical protein